LKKSGLFGLAGGRGRSATGAPLLLGRNLDYPSLGYAHEYSLGDRAIGPTQACLRLVASRLVGCLSGINDAGLSVAILESFRSGSRKVVRLSGTPYGLGYRPPLEECSTTRRRKTLLEKMKRTTTTN